MNSDADMNAVTTTSARDFKLADQMENACSLNRAVRVAQKLPAQIGIGSKEITRKLQASMRRYAHTRLNIVAILLQSKLAKS